jgi:hypothetical protein
MIRKIVSHASLLNFTTTTDFKDLSHKLSLSEIDIVEK